MANVTWNSGDPYLYCEIVVHAYGVARGGRAVPYINIFHFGRSTPLLAISQAHIESAFQAAIGAKMLLALNVDYTQLTTSVRFFQNPLEAPFFVTEAGVGAIAGDRLPDFCSAVIQLKSGIRGKPYRGSKHFGPVSESDTTGDALTAPALTRFQTLGAAIIAGFTDSDGNHWLPGLKGGVRVGSPAQYVFIPTTTVWTDLNAYLVNGVLGTMRRRRARQAG